MQPRRKNEDDVSRKSSGNGLGTNCTVLVVHSITVRSTSFELPYKYHHRTKLLVLAIADVFALDPELNKTPSIQKPSFPAAWILRSSSLRSASHSPVRRANSWPQVGFIEPRARARLRQRYCQRNKEQRLTIITGLGSKGKRGASRTAGRSQCVLLTVSTCVNSCKCGGVNHDEEVTLSANLGAPKK